MAYTQSCKECCRGPFSTCRAIAGGLRQESMKRVCNVDPVLTRYRMPVFLELSRYCYVDWIFSPSNIESGFASSSRPESPGLRYIEVPVLKPFGETAGMFQRGLTRYILREKPDAI